MAEPLPGDVWRYDYLWRWQHDGGETEGRKRRPTAMVAVIRAPDGTFLFILPITSSPPAAGRIALEIPQIERRRTDLDDIPLWIMSMSMISIDSNRRSISIRKPGSGDSAAHFFARCSRRSQMRRGPTS